MVSKEKLELILSESVQEVLERETKEFDRLTERCGRSIILFGSGGLGRKVLKGLRSHGIEPLGFADNNPGMWGTEIEGLQVFPPDMAAKKYGQVASFVICIWGATKVGHRMAKVVSQLSELGCVTVVPFSFLFWKYPEAFLPYFCIDLPHKMLLEKSEILEAFSLWEDDFSRGEYLNQIKWRFLADWSLLSDPVPDEQYFVDDLFKLNENEAFIDCGAFDGDTIKSFLQRRGNDFQALIAMEPDPQNYETLNNFLDSLKPEIRKKIKAYPYAVSNYNGHVFFQATGQTDAKVSDSGTVKVECVRLDDILEGLTTTFVKMDIEGSELSAIEGLSKTIAKDHPILAVSAYHKQSDIWRIPLAMKRLYNDYSFFLRPHLDECWDLVCYAIPKDRVVKKS
ncbi:FkbM family methyltransferase [Desulfosporosinus fructosivorans]|uniref:FkbM family methyltransferase n=1 Tax=Desulfosporosinus fructosivorans TaxID=2018669 RepID=A0A4Z0QY93_9FIRM|nr:FkbM family methyltransferase [Desulfosporosinus fructosivorans]TGE35390.1 FkbM family methyltransferase [Desulfosporosinus fructosivorans]